MTKTGILLPGKEWKVLDKEQVKIIDNAAYTILNQIGAFIDDVELLKMAQQMGAEVNFEKKIAKGFPEDVIKGSVAKAPKNFVLAGRDPAWDLVIEGPGRKQFWGASSGATDRIYYNEQGKPYRRRANKDDVAYTARIIDGIDDFDWDGYLFDTAEEGQLGLPSELIRLDAMLKNTTKFTGNVCTTVSNIREYDYIQRLAAVVAGGDEELRKRPLFETVYNLIGYLQINKFNSWSLRASIKHHFPIHPGVTSIAPLQAPATAAGNVAVSHAGNLLLMAIKQFYDPGAPMTPNNACLAVDPFTGKGTLMSAHSLWGVSVMNQLYHEIYGLPTYQYMGTYAGSFDYQSTIMAANTLLQMVIGTDRMMLQFGTEALDPILIPMIAELAHWGRHVISKYEQILPTEYNLAIDLAKQYGPTGEGWIISDFNMEKLDNFYRTITMETRPFDTWLREGAQSWESLCKEKLKELEKHEPAPLPKDVKERMDAIVKEGIDLLKRK